jgi:hypothetical protein
LVLEENVAVLGRTSHERKRSIGTLIYDESSEIKKNLNQQQQGTSLAIESYFSIHPARQNFEVSIRDFVMCRI